MNDWLSAAKTHRFSLLLAPVVLLACVGYCSAQGQTVSDDFEDEEWKFTHHWPKGSYNDDKQRRLPPGGSTNGLWSESLKRGQPDYIVRVPTPEGGLPGSKGALLMRSLYSKTPDSKTGGFGQDDLIFNCVNEVGHSIPANWNPIGVVRVYVPPFKEWEQRTGTTFGFRAAVESTTTERKRRFLVVRTVRKSEVLYPGMFIQFNCKADGGAKEDSAVFIVRASTDGQDFFGPRITGPGWWTLGLSCSGDGRMHYYAKRGVKPLTDKDRFASTFPWGQRAERFQTIFFNVCNSESGVNWSTPWIIDDPVVRYGR